MNIIEYLKLFSSHTDYEEYVTGGTMVKPNVSYCEDVKDVHYNPIIPHDYSQDYFATVALENGTITFTPTESNAISYSTDNGNTWVEGNSVNVVNGDKVLWKGTMTPLGLEGIGVFYETTCNFDVKGNVMSLIYGDDFKNQLSLEGKHDCFYFLLGESSVVNAKDLVLPATTLADSCYHEMFGMCRRLTSAPQLPATTLANFCYSSMFVNCIHLTTAPQLPVTTLAEGCYNYMFNECTSLTTAPELPATTLVDYCYEGMFQGCTSLNYIKAMFTTTPSLTYTGDWVDGVAVSGTFVKNSVATWDVSGVNGVPNGWTVETASE